MLKPYIVEYNDPWSCFDRTTVKAEDLDSAWIKIKENLKSGSIVLRVYEPVFNGEYLIGDYSME